MFLVSICIESKFSLKICEPMSDDKKSVKPALSLFKPSREHIKKGCSFPIQSKI